MVIPGLVIVVDNSSTKAPSRVDARSSDGDGGQVNHEHSKSNWKWSQNLPAIAKRKTKVENSKGQN